MAQQRTMGAILNEASDNMQRDAAMSRQAALQGVQLKGAIEDQRYQAETRGREREYLNELRNVYDEEMFVKKPVAQQPTGAIPTPDASGNFPAPEYTKVAVDPSSKEGMQAIGRVQMRSVALRQKYGLAKADEVQGLLDFRTKLENAGVADDFRSAMNGDVEALNRVSKRFNLENVKSIVSGQDENGFLNIFAMTSGAGGAQSRVPIGHLMAAFSPEFDAMMKGSRESVKASDDLKNSASTRTLQDRQGLAALQNAEANSARSTARAISNESTLIFETKLNQDPNKYLTPFTNFLNNESIVDDQARGFLSLLGGEFIEGGGFQPGAALNTARSTLNSLNIAAKALYDKEVDEARKAGDQDKLASLEDNQVTIWQGHRQRLINNYMENLRKQLEASKQPTAEK